MNITTDLKIEKYKTRFLTFGILLFAVLISYKYYIIKKTPIASWHMINVNYAKNQGDANLLLIGDEVILIDTGYSEEAQKELIPYLEKLGMHRILC